MRYFAYFSSIITPPMRSTLFPYTTLFRSHLQHQTRRPHHFVTRRGIDNEVMRRSEEHTSELQSHSDLVCRLLLVKKNIVNSWCSEIGFDLWICVYYPNLYYFVALLD